MTYIKSFTLYFASLMLLAGLALAQEQDRNEAAGKASSKGRVAYLACTSFPKDMENPVLVRAGKKVISIELSKRLVSDPIKISKQGIIEIVRKSDEGEYTVIARAKAPEAARKTLVIISPLAEKPTDKSPLLFSSKAINLSKFRGGDNLYINLSPSAIICKLGKNSITVKPMSSQIYHPEGLKKSTNIPIQYGYYAPKTKQWKLLSASTIVLRPTRREICIFSWNHKYKRIGYHGITFPVDADNSD